MKKRGLVPGAVAYWDCTQVVGQVLPDLSGNGNDAMLGSTAGADTNDPTAGPTGLTFGGDDYASAGTVPALNIGTGDYTITAVITPSNNSATPMVVAGKGGTSTHRSELGLSAQAFRHVYRGTDSPRVVVADGTYIIGAPYFVTAVRSGSELSLWIGAAKQANTATVTTEASVINKAFVLGATSDGAAYQFVGTEHMVAVYPFALTTAQIAQEYAYFRAKFAPLGVVLP